MAVISPTLINYYADQAGFRGNARVIAVAVALAESGGNTTARHLNTNGTWDTGLWQINSVHTQYNQQLLLDPAYNARAAFAISSGGSNWHPWTTYNTGAYQKFMGTASGAPGNATPPPSTVGKPGQGAAAALTVDQVFSSKGLWKWYSSHVTNGYDGINEKGEDFSTAWGTAVGVVVGGKVVRSVHNNNSIGDVVEIQAGDGSVWLYQHIRAKVRPGQLVSTGDIVGTEDGLPRDKYSTGPHIEVRYCPPGRWNASTGSWTEPWINPRAIFSAIGASHATGPNVTTGPGSPTTPGGPAGTTSAFITNISVPGPSTYVPLLDQVHETLVNHPGFYGIALTLDEAEQFPGWINLTQPTEIDTVVGNFPVPDVTGTVRSVGATVTDNFLPFAIRSGLVLLGMALVFALVVKPVMQVAGPVAEVLA